MDKKSIAGKIIKEIASEAINDGKKKLEESIPSTIEAVTNLTKEINPQNFKNIIKNYVDHPQHYGGDTHYEVIKVLEAWDLGFHLGNVVKYVARAGRKDRDKEIEDLKKASWYLQRYIEKRELETKRGKK